MPVHAVMTFGPDRALAPEGTVRTAMARRSERIRQLPGTDEGGGDVEGRPGLPLPVSTCRREVTFAPGENGVRDTIAGLGAKAQSVGIVSASFSRDLRERCKAIVLLNSRSIGHGEPNRMCVAFARRWAGGAAPHCGAMSSGIGEGAARPRPPENDVHPWRAMDSVAADMHHLYRRMALEMVFLLGMCSVSTHASRAHPWVLP